MRGVAFLGVLSVHCADACGLFPGSILAQQGGYGVQLFFLASAITLCNSMSTRREGRMELANFYLRRLFRIAPLFWLSMVVYWTVPGILPPIWLAQWAPNGIRESYFLLTALFLQGWHPYAFNSIVPGGWSIAVEMTFYLVFPFCFHRIKTLRQAAVCVLFGVALTVLERFLYRPMSSWLWPRVHDPTILGFFGQYWFPSQFAVFLIGIFTYFLIKEPAVEKIYKDPFWSKWLFALCSIFTLSLLNRTVTGFLPPFLVVIALAGTIISLAGNTIPWAVNSIIRYIGTLSYSCYLTHFVALGIILRGLEVLFPQYSLKSPSGVEKLDAGSPLYNLGFYFLVAVTTLILTVIFSTITHHLIENPGIKLGKLVIRSIDKRALQPGKKSVPTV